MTTAMREDSPMSTDTPLLSWFRRVVVVMGNTAEQTHPPAVQQRAWYAAGASGYASERAEWPALDVPATRHLTMLERPDPTTTGIDALVRDLLDLSPTLPWRPSARAGDEGASVALVDLFECLEMPAAGAGVMLLGPGACYPEHAHAPEELYLLLRGNRRWRFGGSCEYAPTSPGQVLSNSANDLHGVEAGDDVMLAVWVLVDG